MRAVIILSTLLGVAHAGETPLPGAQGWYVAGGGTSDEDYEGGVDSSVSHTGMPSVWLRARVAKPQPGGCLMQVAGNAQRYAGKRVRLVAWLRTEGVDSAGLWMRVRANGSDATLAGDQMEKRRALKGTHGWTRAELVVDVPPVAGNIIFGAAVGARGTVWIDDAHLELVP